MYTRYLVSIHFGRKNDKVNFVKKVTKNNLKIISKNMYVFRHDVNTCKVSMEL